MAAEKKTILVIFKGVMNVLIYLIECEWCGEQKETPFPERARFCSTKCSNLWHRANRKEARNCIICGKEFFALKKYGKEPQSRHCSKACEVVSRQRAVIERKALVLYTGPPSTVVPRSTVAPTTIVRPLGISRHGFINGRCRRCGTYFTVQNNNSGGAFYCSKQCAKMDSKARRRARERDVRVGIVRAYEVYERDQWTCYLCGQAIDPALPHNTLYSKTIEHVIAIADGGSHSMDNLRAAHMICNSMKEAESERWLR